jgi:hypothetical protein
MYLRPPEFVKILEDMGIEDPFVAEFYGFATVKSMYQSQKWQYVQLQVDFVHKATMFLRAQAGIHPLAKVDMVRDVIPEPEPPEVEPEPEKPKVIRGFKHL